ncbi:MAG: thioether cross-link-forming SCIFF peptide maturase [Corallococcus sp.]|nr:thioether cross-link-forming SCIFF peptide maturase [Corallococcus sp.]
MIHCFNVCGEYLLYDVESSSLLEIDKIVYDYLSGNKDVLSKYLKEDIAEVKNEIETLRKEGIIDACAPNIDGNSIEKGNIIKSLCIHMSHDCNLRCKYCFAGTGTYHGKRQHMPFDVAQKAIDFLITHSGSRRNLEVDFFGGEPLMNLDVLKRTVEYAKEQAKLHGKVFKFTTTTNGVLLSKETSDYLNAEMDNVVLSLDGRKEVNDYQRPFPDGTGSYDAIIDNYKYFRSIRGNKSYYLRGTFTAQNLDFKNDVLFMADLGFDQISVEPVVLSSKHPLALKEENLPEIFENYEKLAAEYVQRRRNPESWFSFFHFAIDLENGPCYKKRLVGCGAGSEYLAVTPDGNIYPCHQFAGESEFCLGNVYDENLDESVRKVFKNSNVTTKEKCSSCWAKYHCSGGCAANAIHYNEDINKPYGLACEMMKKRLECALYIYAKECK